MGWPKKLSSCLLVLAFFTSILGFAPLALAQLGATFAPPHSDVGEDTDGDNLFNYLAVDVNLQVSVSGEYYLDGYLYDGTGATKITYAYDYATLAAGTQTRRLRFSGRDIYASKINGPYRVSLYLWSRAAENAVSAENIHLTQSYLYTQFQPPAVEPVPPHSDSGIDTDGDNKYDYLEVTINLKVNRAGKYYLSGSLQKGYTYIASAWEEVSLSTGSQTAKLKFDGSQIYNSRQDGPYDVRFYIYSTEEYGRESLGEGTHTTKSYLYTQFQRPGVVFVSGQHSDVGEDTDGDNLFNYLTIKVKLDVAKAGKYSLSGSLSTAVAPSPTENVGLERATYYSGYHIDYAWKEIDLSKGVQEVPLRFSGERIRQSKLDGPYSVELYVYGPHTYEREYYYTSWSGDRDTYTTKSYLHTQFQVPCAELAPPHTDRGEDPDNDGKFDYLTVRVNLNVNRSGKYRVSGTLSGRGGYGYGENVTVAPTGLYAWASAEAYLEAGARYIELKFEGSRIRQSRVNGPYDVYLSLHDADWNYLGWGTHTTRSYSYTEFTEPPVELLAVSERGVDTDGDGKYDYLDVDARLKVNTAGSYFVFGMVMGGYGYGAYGPEKMVVTAKQADLTKGERTVTLRFLGGAIYKFGVNGPYYGVVAVSRTLDFTTEPLVYSSLQTAAHRYTDFELPPVEFSAKPIVDYGEDTNNDNKFDYLTVEAKLNVRTPGKYAVWGMVMGKGMMTTGPLDWKLVESRLDNGEQTVKVRFDGWKLAAAGDGRFNVILLLLDPTGEQLWMEIQGISVPMAGWLEWKMYQTGYYDSDKFSTALPAHHAITAGSFGSLRVGDMKTIPLENRALITVTAIKVVAKRAISNLNVSVIESPEKPTGLPDIENAVAISYLTINAGGRAASGVIYFRVDKAKAKELGIDPDNVVLHRFDGEWIALETTRVGEDETYVYYEAETPAFSSFGIAGPAAPLVVAPPFPIVIVLGAAVAAISLAALLLWRRKQSGTLGF